MYDVVSPAVVALNVLLRQGSNHLARLTCRLLTAHGNTIRSTPLFINGDTVLRATTIVPMGT